MAIRHYRLILTVEGLVHVGNGEAYGKKDYIAREGKISVLDMPKFIGKLNSADFNAYCSFLRDKNNSLQDYLEDHPNAKRAAQDAMLYEINSSLAKGARSRLQRYEVFKFIKDIHRCPYVPGSSVKGLLRSAIMISVMLGDREPYRKLYATSYSGQKLEEKAFKCEKPDCDNEAVVRDIMHYVSVSDSRPLSVQDLVFAQKYDKFSKSDDGRHKKPMGQRSDSSFCDGNKLNVYRECLKPGTRIEFDIDIDENIDAYLSPINLDAQGIALVLRRSFDLYSTCFLERFNVDDEGTDAVDNSADDRRCRYVIQEGPFKGQRCRNWAVEGSGYCNRHKNEVAVPQERDDRSSQDGGFCYLGGGTDFNTKTVINALFDENQDHERLGEISHILYKQFNTRLDFAKHEELRRDIEEAGYKPEYMRSHPGRTKEDHRHWKDVGLGVSPHTMKFGIYDNKHYPMGKCSVRIETR